jgi:hypothetical protein
MFLKPLVCNKNELAKLIANKNYYKSFLGNINYCLKNKEKLYKNYEKMCDDKKWKYCRIMLFPLNDVNSRVNEYVLKRFDKEIPVYIYWWLTWKSHIDATLIHRCNYNRSYIILDFSKYFEQVSYDMVFNSLQKLWIANKKWAEIIAKLWCVAEWKEIKKDWNMVVARWFCTSSRLAIYGTLKFFKNLNTLLYKELKWLKHRLSVFVDDITISFDNVEKKKVENLLIKIYLLAKKEWYKFNDRKTLIYNNVSQVEILGILVKRWNIEPTKDLKRKISNKYRDLCKAKNDWEKYKIYESLRWLKRYKNNLFLTNFKVVN